MYSNQWLHQLISLISTCLNKEVELISENTRWTKNLSAQRSIYPKMFWCKIWKEKQHFQSIHMLTYWNSHILNIYFLMHFKSTMKNSTRYLGCNRLFIENDNLDFCDLDLFITGLCVVLSYQLYWLQLWDSKSEISNPPLLFLLLPLWGWHKHYFSTCSSYWHGRAIFSPSNLIYLSILCSELYSIKTKNT